MLTVEDGFFVKPFARVNRVHYAIGEHAICGIGRVRPASYNSKLKTCERCIKVRAAYTSPTEKI